MSRDASSDDDLRINTLHRFAKHSPRLTLQEYSHCEVPAGCGGVVLRWVDPRRGVPIRLRVVVLGEAETWLDGAPLPGSFTRIEPGTHVIALHVTKLGTAIWADDARPPLLPAPFVLDVIADRGPNHDDHETSFLAGASFIERRWTSTAPPREFSEPAFDDRAWRQLEPAAPEMLARSEDHVRRAYERLRDGGATIFALGDTGADVLGRGAEAWARVRFTLHESALRESSSPPDGR